MELYNFAKVCDTLLRKRKWHFLLAKRKGHVQTLLEHSMNALGLGITLIKHGLLDLPGNGVATKAFLLGLITHDAGKESHQFQQYLHGGSYANHVDVDLSEEIACEICQELQWELPKEALAAVLLHMKGTDTVGSNFLEILKGHKESNWRTIATLVAEVDNIVSTTTPQEAHRAWRLSKVLNQSIRSTYHSLKIRGTSSVYLHKALEDAHIQNGWLPVLYFATGTLYLNKEINASIPTKEQIYTTAIDAFSQVMEENKHKQVIMMHGNITATYLVKPELFTTDVMVDLLKLAAQNIRLRQSKEINDDVLLAYLNMRTLLKKTGDVQLAKKANNKQVSKLRDQISPELQDALCFSVSDLSMDYVESTKSRIGEAYKELAVLKMFKNIMDPGNGILPVEGIKCLLKRYDQVFGEGTFEALRATANLMPAQDVALTVDFYWDSPANKFGINEKFTVYPFLDTRRRLDILIEKLERIALDVFEQLGVKRSLNSVLKFMVEEFLADIEYPIGSEDLTFEAVKHLEASLQAKLNAASSRHVLRTCPLCNKAFTQGKMAIDDFVSKGFTNRLFAYTKADFHVCLACYFERMLQQMILGGKAGEFICVFPLSQLTEQQKQELTEKVNAFNFDIAKFTSGMKMGSGHGKSYLNYSYTLSLESKLADNLIEKGNCAFEPQCFGDIFTYRKAEKQIEKQRQKLIEILKEQVAPVPSGVAAYLNVEYPTWDEIVDAIVSGVHDDLPDIVKARKIAFGFPAPIQIVYATPNFILFPTFNHISQQSAIATDKNESNTKTAYKRLFIATLFARYLGLAVAIVDQVEGVGLLAERVEGMVYVPEHPRVRNRLAQVRSHKVVGLESTTSIINTPWLFRDKQEVDIWLNGILASIMLAPILELTSRDDISQILEYRHPGEVLRRAVQKQDGRKTAIPSELWHHVQALKEVLC